MKNILALDQGTTSSRAIVYNENGATVSVRQVEFKQHFPQPGWVEHDPVEIWRTTLETARDAIETAKVQVNEIAAIGITNQRETAVIWDRETGEPIHNAIVWQDRRTSARIAELRNAGIEPDVQAATGLLLDPYFTATKFEWLLDHVEGARGRAERGELCAGTIDSWLVYKLTKGRRHVIDVTNASRTLLMNLDRCEWDDAMLEHFRVPRAMLPEIIPSSGSLAECDPECFGKALPVCGIAGDQQAALFGQRCVTPGAVKCTYGTGCFMLLFTGTERVNSRNRLLTTAAWEIGDGPLQFAIEGGVFVGGAAIQWLRDGLGIIKSAPEVNELAAQVPDAGGVQLVPAFAGLGAPYWDSCARGLLVGLTRGTTAAHIARATLEGIANQVADLLEAMRADSGREIPSVRVDGGAAASDLLMQIQADTLGIPVERPANVETTALGAAFLAGLGSGMWKAADDLSSLVAIERTFEPQIDDAARAARRETWRDAVQRSKGWAN